MLIKSVMAVVSDSLSFASVNVKSDPRKGSEWFANH